MILPSGDTAQGLFSRFLCRSTVPFRRPRISGMRVYYPASVIPDVSLSSVARSCQAEGNSKANRQLPFSSRLL
jgi:hypothetical protein